MHTLGNCISFLSNMSSITIYLKQDFPPTHSGAKIADKIVHEHRLLFNFTFILLFFLIFTLQPPMLHFSESKREVL